MHIFNVCCAGGGGRLKVKAAVHPNVLFKAETGLLNLELSSNCYPWLLGHTWEGLWGAALFLALCMGEMG